MMSRTQLVLLYLSAGLTAGTGLVFAIMKYAMKSDDPFAVVNHPLQPWMLSSHIIVAAFAVFAFGWVFGNHIVPAYSNSQTKRPSGIWSMLSIAPMVLSGYLLQVSTADAMRKAMATAHWITSGWFVLAFAVHLLWRRS